MSQVVDQAGRVAIGWTDLRVLLASLRKLLPTATVLGFYWFIVQRASFVDEGRRYYTLFDDAMISLRFARNLAQGNGLNWNMNEAPVEGFTNPLWTIWMSLLHFVGLSEATVGLAVACSSAVLLFATAFIVRSVARRLYPMNDLPATIGFWGTLVYYPLVFWSLRGMEVGLIAFLLATAVLLALRLQASFTRRDLLILCSVSAFGLLTRVEFAVPMVVIAGFLFLQCRGKGTYIVLVLGGTMLVVLAALTIARLFYYGELLPNTYFLKVAGIGIEERLTHGFWALVFGGVTHLSGLAVLCALYVASMWRRLAVSEWLLLALFASVAAYSAWVGGDAWEDYFFANRYISPAIPLLLVIAARAAQIVSAYRFRQLLWPICVLLGISCLNLLLDAPRGTPDVLRAAVFFGMAATLFTVGTRAFSGRTAAWFSTVVLLVSLSLPPMADWLLRGAPHSAGDAAMSAYGLLLRETTTSDASIAVTWAGAVSYYSQRASFDELGKTDKIIAHGPHVADTFRPGHSKWNLDYSIGELRPDVITGLLVATAEDIQRIESWGYVNLIGSCYYLRDSREVDSDRLREGLMELKANPRLGPYICPPPMER